MSHYVIILNSFMMLMKVIVYEIFLDSSGTCTVFLRQTSIMHNNFDRFGEFVSIDATKRGLKNSYVHMCLSPFIMRWKHFVLVASVLFVPKRHKYYITMMNFMISNSPEQKREKVYVVAADEIFT